MISLQINVLIWDIINIYNYHADISDAKNITECMQNISMFEFELELCSNSCILHWLTELFILLMLFFFYNAIKIVVLDVCKYIRSLNLNAIDSFNFYSSKWI